MVGATQLKWSPFVRHYFDDPYAVYRECREKNPIHYDRYGNLMVFTYDEVALVLKSKDCQVSNLSEYFEEKEAVIFKQSGQCPFLAASTSKWLMYLNGTVHRRIRIGLGKVLFSYNWQEFIEQAVAETNQEFEGREGFDLSDYSKFFIFRILDRFIGMEHYESFEKIAEYSNLLSRSQDLFVTRQMYLKINEVLTWGRPIFDNSLFRKKLKEELADIEINDTDLYSLLAMTLMAFFETSKDNFSMTLLQLLSDPSLIQYVEDADAKAIKLISEEMLRFNSPLQFTVRINCKDMMLRDQLIPSGTKMILCIGSANRDETVFEQPDTIVLDRKINPHFAFGSGEHICLGSLIARKEMEIGLKGMTGFLKQYTIEERSIRWANQIFMRTLDKAMVSRKPL